MYVQDSQSARDHDFSDHIIFVLCAGSYSHEIGLVNFVRPLRTSSLFTHRLRDIVFYTDPSFVEAEWKTIANFPKLFVYPVRVAVQWRRSEFILRGRNFYPHRETGRGTKLPETRRAESGDGVLGEWAAPPARGSGERCNLPQRIGATLHLKIHYRNSL